MDSTGNCPENLIIAKRDLASKNEENKKLVAQLATADTELQVQHEQNEKLTADLLIADNELLVQQQEILLAEEHMEFERHNVDALINNTNDLMWSVDTNFNLIISNKPFDDMVILMAGEPLKKGDNVLTVAFPQEQLIKYKVSYERAFAGDIFSEIEHHQTPIDIWSEISYYPIKNGDEIVGAACHSRNITSSKNTEAERNEIATDLSKRNKALEQFADMVSHNLRGPIACILGATMVFNDIELNDEDKTTLATGINESAVKLDKVFKDLNQIIQLNHK